MAQTPSTDAPVIRGATVTTEDGGRLNAFASEPRMQVVEAEQGWGKISKISIYPQLKKLVILVQGILHIIPC